MTVITAEKALEALEAVVAERGEDTEYWRDIEPDRGPMAANCRYADEDGSPLCLIGEVLHRFDLLKYISETWNETPFNILLVPALRKAVSPKAWKILSQAQFEQDMGAPWGQALEAAREYAERSFKEDA